MTQTITMTANGQPVTVEVEPRWLLADVLRDQLRLTGTHLGCEHGVCGACTILLDDRPVRACLLLAVQARNHHVTTVEGLGDPEHLHPLQRAFQQEHALQCGFCTPGMLMTAYHFLATHSNPTRREIREALAGNILPLHGLPVHRQRRRARGKRDGPARRRRQLTCRWTPLQRVASSERLK